MRTIVLILFFLFSGASSAYDTCVAYHPSNNPNPTLPCSYNGYDYDSLAVEAGVNSLFYKGEKYVLTDNDWWWSLTSPAYVTQDGILYAWGSWHPEYHSLSFSKDGALFFGAGASYTPHQLTVNLTPQAGGMVASNPTSDFACSNGVCQGGFSGNIALTATPAENCMFAYWNDGTVTTSENPLTVSMNSDKTLSAVFICSLKWPLSGSKESRTILLGFGADWIDSCGGQVMKHAGIDIETSVSEIVYAAESGAVKVAQTHQQWGGWVVLEHDGYTTVYWHIMPSVSVNSSVVKGDPIGTVVNYGGPVHLHFGLRERQFSQNNVPSAGALPQAICDGYPAFPEYFVDPETFSYQ